MHRNVLGTLTLLLIFLSGDIAAQVGIPVFQKGIYRLKDLLHEAKEKDAILMVVFYSPKVAVDVLPQIKRPDSLLSSYNIVVDVADPFIEMADLSIRLKQYYNPGWVLIHPDNRIIFYSNNVKTDTELHLLVSQAEKVKLKYDAAIKLLDEDKNNAQGLEDMILVMSAMFETNGLDKYLNRYIKSHDSYTDKEIKFLMGVALRAPGNNKLDALMQDNKNRIIQLTSLNEYNSVRQSSIVGRLKRRQLYEPYMIWKEFEKEFGNEADSLYRLSAIKYFRENPDLIDERINEIIDYLDIYPDTPWEHLDPLFTEVLGLVKSHEDLEIILDLIGGQLFQGENYRKLDYRALILYRLGKKERSLSLIAEVMALAQKENVKYRSMIYNLNKK